MMLEVNIPAVKAEVERAFAEYEAALTTNDVATLDRLFHDSPETLRYGVGEHLHGYAEIAAFRAARAPFNLERTLERTQITTYGHDMGIAWTLFRRESLVGKIGRQSQVWLRTPDGWRVIAAHVSIIADPSQRDPA